MNSYGPETYGDRIASVYDSMYAATKDFDTSVALLAELAHGGRALELGIGTGRVALPLARLGVEVHGIDASRQMVAELRSKRGGKGIDVTIGDFSRFSIRPRFDLVYVVFNTFFGLLTQDDQVACFASVAKHLKTSGVFLIEAFKPDLSRFRHGQSVSASNVDTDQVKLDVTHHDAVAQTVTTSYVLISEAGVKLYPVRLRYAWPAELDLMAQLAGLRLVDRWGDWDRRDFTANSARHISVWSRS